MKIVHLLVRTDIQCSDNDPFPLHGSRYRPVSQKLLFFRRVILCTEVQKLRAEQPDALPVVFLYGRNILQSSDIAVDHHLPSVQSDIFLSLHGFQKLFSFRLLLEFFFQRCQCDWVRIYDQFARFSVDIAHPSGIAFLQRVACGTHRRNSHRPRQNSRMRII